jgi:hypothetical protein
MGMVLAFPLAGRANWVAYNDGSAATAPTGNYTAQGPTPTPVSFFLKDNADGSLLDVQATFTPAGAASPAGGYVPSPAAPALPTGSLAYDTFYGKVSQTEDYTEWNSDYVTLSFTGLTASCRYTFVYYASRGSTNASYAARIMDVILSGASAFTNSSSAGVTIFTSITNNDSATLIVGNNTNGSVVRFTGIDAGADGAIRFKLAVNSSLGQFRAYANAFMLQEIELPGVPSILNTEATVESRTAATLAGQLNTTGAAPTQVWVYWRTGSDGGTNRASWTGSGALGYRAAGELSYAVSGLQTNTTYYYRYYASNVYGQAWAPSAATFTTLAGGSGVYPVITGPAPKRQTYAASRLTGFIISEILYHPRPGQEADGEFIEIYNTESWPEDLTGYRLTGTINYMFPSGTVVNARSYLVVAQNPGAISNRYGSTGVLGPYVGTLNDDGGVIRLKDMAGYPLLEATYDDGNAWPLSADGSGHSMVLSRPDYGADDPRGWSASALIGGTPGSADRPLTNYPPASVMINEFLAHTDPPLYDSVELYNKGTGTVNLSGCYLTDDADNPTKYRIADGTSLAPRACRVFADGGTNISLKLSDGRIYLFNPECSAVLDVVEYEAQQNAISMGRTPDGSPYWSPLADRSLGITNGPALTPPIVISEIMYHPISGSNVDEYVELHNRTATNIPLAYWRFTAGIDFMFPINASIPAGGYLVVAKDVTNLIARYPGVLNTTNCIGSYGGTLSDGGERVALSKPDDLSLPYQEFVVMDEVTYSDGWGSWADGGGSSLELIDSRAESRMGMNWADSDETTNGVWTTIEKTGIIDNCLTNSTVLAAWDYDMYRINRSIHVFMLGGGECLIDDVQILKNGSPITVLNGDFNSGLGTWISYGTHDTTTGEAGTGVGGTGAMHLRAQAAGSDGYNGTMGYVDTGLNFNDTNVTVRFKAKWLKGARAVSGLLKGNAIEAWGLMNVNPNGTPGRQNSRYAANTTPAIEALTHSPILPPSSSNVTVSARVNDPDGLGAVELKYRIDPGYTTNTVSMNDGGTAGDLLAGDGIYSGQIPGAGMASNTMVAFVVEARDPQGNRSRIPAAVEGLVLYGQIPTPGDYVSFRMLTCNTTMTNWYYNFRLSNKRFPVTLIYNTDRAVYEARSKIKGSPWSRSRPNFKFYTAGQAAATIPELEHGFQFRLPKNEPVTGAGMLDMDGLNYRERGLTNLTPMDPLFMRERLYFWLVRQAGMPSMHQRFVHLYGNNFHKGIVYGDGSYPDADLAGTWYDSEGAFNSGTASFAYRPDWDGGGNIDDKLDSYKAEIENETIEVRADATGKLKEEYYHRWWERDGNNEEALDFSRLFAFIRMANMPLDDNYAKYFGMAAEPVGMMESIAGRHIAANNDCWTGEGKSAGLFFPTHGLAMPTWWDIDYGMGVGGATNDLMPVDYVPTPTGHNFDETMNAKAFKSPALMRNYWRKHQELVDGPLQTNRFNTMIDRYYQGHISNGISAFIKPIPNDSLILIPSEIDRLKVWLAGRRVYLSDRILTYTNCPFSVATTSFSTGNKQATLSGIAPVRVMSIRATGVEQEASWSTLTNWQIKVALTANGANPLNITAHDRSGTLIGSGTPTVTYSGTPGTQASYLVINEIMYNPAMPSASFVEVFNRSSTEGFDIGGMKLGGADFIFAPGTWLGPTSYCVVAGDLPAFAEAYTGDVLRVVGKYEGSLDNGGERVTLEQPIGTFQYQTNDAYGQTIAVTVTNYTLLDEVTYDDDQPWPAAADGLGASLQLIDPAQDNNRVGNWGVSMVPAQMYTPGRTNSIGRTLLPLASLWINEIMSSNATSSITDNYGQREPWLELYNAGSAIDLAAGPYYLTDSMGNLTQWSFPAGLSTIGAGSMLRIWCDGQTNQTAAGHLHTPFRLNSESGIVAIVRMDTQPVIVDAVVYSGIGADRSFGCAPDGNAANRIVFDYPSPGAINTNTSRPVIIYVNEWMADNASGGVIADPADGDFDDWFELYNADTATVNLGGYVLCDDGGVTNGYVIPGGWSLTAHSFMLIWADNETDQNAAGRDLHVNFKLGASGDQLRLYAPDGTLVNGVTFGAQQKNVSEGRYADGGPDTKVMYIPTPGSSNRLFEACAVQAPSGGVFRVTWNTLRGQRYELRSTWDMANTNWVSYSVETNAMTNTMTFSLPEDGSRRFYRLLQR